MSPQEKAPGALRPQRAGAGPGTGPVIPEAGLPDTQKHDGNMQMNRKKMSKRKKIVLILLSLAVCAAAVTVGLMLYGRARMARVPGLTFREAPEYTTHGKKDAVITVGAIRDGQAARTVCGEDGQELPAQKHTCEIGPLTRTITDALINRAIGEGKVDLNATVDACLPLPGGKRYPTILELLTRTSGYSGYCFEIPMIGNFSAGRNSFCGVSREMVLNRAKGLDMNRDSCGFEYSNYGYAVLGLVPESVYGETYTALVNGFLHDDLGLTDTRISDRSGDLGQYWDWETDDGHLSAGALTSDIADMLACARMQPDGDARFAACHEPLKAIDASPESCRMMGIRMDETGMVWITDSENGFIWHNGGTGHYNSDPGFCPETGTAAAVLSNLSPGDRIPATVPGIKRLRELNQPAELRSDGEAAVTDPLWEITNPNDFVVALMEHLERKTQNGRDLSSLSAAERVVYVTQTLEMEVNNGGFSQFFWNSSGDYANEVVSAYQALGAEKTAGICRRALDAFGRDLPADRAEREEMLDELLNDEISGILDECDRSFYAYEENLAELTYRYASENREAFTQP